MSRRRAVALIFLAAVITAACDRTPVDPGTDASDAATLLFGPEAARAAAPPLSLPSLVHAAILEVYNAHGADAARAMVVEMRRLQDDASMAVDAPLAREGVRVARQTLQDEQLGIVLRVFGDDVVGRIIGTVRTDIDALTRRLDGLDANGLETTVPRSALAEGRELLADAEAAWSSGALRASLAAATDAAARVDAARAGVAGAMRVPGLDELFAVAVRVAGGRSSAPRADLLDEHRRLDQIAQQAVRTGTRESAHAALAAVRAEEIAVVLRVLGPGAVDQLVQRSREARTALVRDVRSAGDAGREVLRMERMLTTAADLIERADAALDAGDAATALDLGSHAAGLVNGVQLALSPG